MTEAQVHRVAAKLYLALAEEREIDDLIAVADREWRTFAKERDLVIKQAGKTRMGPYSGQSAARHLWVNPDAMVQMVQSVRQIYATVLTRPQGITLPDWFVEAQAPRASPPPHAVVSARASSPPKPVAVRKSSREEALQRLFAELVTRGWVLQKYLKTPHATSPDGRLRLWFKPRAIHYTSASDGRHDAGNARSTGIEDIVKQEPGPLVDYIQRVFAG
jgi:hypothetical protein